MKKRITLLALLFFSLSSFGQLTVSSNGIATVGSNTQNSSNSKLIVYGNNKTNGSNNLCVSFTQNDHGRARVECLRSNGNTWSSFYSKQGTHSYAAYYDGCTFVNGSMYARSDINYKENIRAIDNPLQRLQLLNGVLFDFKKDTLDYPDENHDFIESCRTNNLGFIAQGVQTVFPELVVEDITNGHLGLNYDGFSAVLVEAIKEQQRTIESLQKEIAELKVDAARTYGTESTVASQCVLYQNSPNPTNSSTTIECYINSHDPKAAIAVYDLNGTQLKEYPLYRQGRNTVTIEANEFRPGIYIYSLLVNNALIDTKRMVITSK